MAWTDERIAILEKMWTEGQSAAEIAKTLGEGVTRNAVIGKAHRMGLSGRPSPIKKTATPKKAPKKKAEPKAKKTTTKAKAEVKETPAKAEKPAVEKKVKAVKAPEPVVPTPRKVSLKDGESGATILDLTDRMCKWPIGDPRDQDFHFCAGPSRPGTPYCDEHSAMAYQTSTRGARRK